MSKIFTVQKYDKSIISGKKETTYEVISHAIPNSPELIDIFYCKKHGRWAKQKAQALAKKLNKETKTIVPGKHLTNQRVKTE